MCIHGSYCIPEQVIQRTEQRMDNTPVCRIRGEKGSDRCKTNDKAYDKHRQNRIAEPFLLRRKRIAVLLLFLTHPSEKVLHDPQRTYHAAIEPSEEQREKEQPCQYGKVQCHQSRKELDLGGPAEPYIERPSDTQKEKRDNREEEDGKHRPYETKRVGGLFHRTGGMLLSTRTHSSTVSIPSNCESIGHMCVLSLFRIFSTSSRAKTLIPSCSSNSRAGVQMTLV